MLAIGGLVAVVGALAWVLLVGLNDAATFFYNVDEALERKEQLQGERFRIQGSVVDGSVEDTEDGVGFLLRYGGAQVPVEHTGTPPELFGPKIPVVLEGTFEGDAFASDQILVKHDNTYDEDNPDRIRQAERDAGSEATAGDDRGTGG
jgi:cytochrome c-type biogenesis protein CcmE